MDDAKDNADGPSRWEAEATQMAKDLDGLVAKIKEIGQSGSEELKDAAAESIAVQLKALQAKFGELKVEHHELISKVDKSVKANPYLYIVGALGLGVLLGKAMRS